MACDACDWETGSGNEGAASSSCGAELSGGGWVKQGGSSGGRRETARPPDRWGGGRPAGRWGLLPALCAACGVPVCLCAVPLPLLPMWDLLPFFSRFLFCFPGWRLGGQPRLMHASQREENRLEIMKMSLCFSGFIFIGI